MRTVAVAVVLWVAVAGGIGAEVLRIGYMDVAPHIGWDGTRTVGPVVDLWTEVLGPGMGVAVVWIGPLPPVRLLASLRDGQLDAAAWLVRTPEREALFVYPDQALSTIEAGVAVRRGSPLARATSASAFRGKRLVFFSEGYIAPRVRASGAEWDLLVAQNWRSLGLRKVIDHWADGAYDADVLTLKDCLAQEGLSDRMDLVTVPDSRGDIYTVFSRTGAERFLKTYNEVWGRSKSEDPGLYSRLLAPYLN